MAIATLTSKHQITIPKEVREKLQLRGGDQIKFDACDTGEFVIHKAQTPLKSDGAAKQYIKPGKRLSVGEIKASAQVGAVNSFKSADL